MVDLTGITLPPDVIVTVLCLLEIIHLLQTGAVSLTFHGIGKEVGTAVTGYLFTKVGTMITLCSYAAATVVLLVIFLIYLFASKNPEGYKKLPETVDPELEDVEEAENAEEKVGLKE